MKWITRQHVRVDRVMGASLFRRYLDTAAEFNFFPPNTHPAHVLAHGFSALGLTDNEMLERESIDYDALHERCRSASRCERSY